MKLSRRILTILPPKEGLRRYYTVLIRPGPRRKLQRSTGSHLRSAATEFGKLLIRQKFPHLVDEKPLPKITP